MNKMMMPEVEVVRFEAEDILTTSKPLNAAGTGYIWASDVDGVHMVSIYGKNEYDGLAYLGSNKKLYNIRRGKYIEVDDNMEIYQDGQLIGIYHPANPFTQQSN